MLLFENESKYEYSRQIKYVDLSRYYFELSFQQIFPSFSLEKKVVWTLNLMFFSTVPHKTNSQTRKKERKKEHNIISN